MPPKKELRSDYSALSNDYNDKNWTVPHLKDLCRFHGLPVSGKKADLLGRLDDNDSNIPDAGDKPPPPVKKAPAKKAAPKKATAEPAGKKTQKKQDGTTSAPEGKPTHGPKFRQIYERGSDSESEEGLEEVTPAVKDRAKGYMEVIRGLRARLRNEQAGPDREIYETVFWSVYEDLRKAVDALDEIIQTKSREPSPVVTENDASDGEVEVHSEADADHSDGDHEGQDDAGGESPQLGKRKRSSRIDDAQPSKKSSHSRHSDGDRDEGELSEE